ncbi:unnamed protein product, partial [Rangifer tarandus platyrhynchus]
DKNTQLNETSQQAGLQKRMRSSGAQTQAWDLAPKRDHFSCPREKVSGVKITGGNGKEEVLFACCHGDGPRLPTGPSARQSPWGLSIPTVSGRGLTGSRASSLSFRQLSPNPVASAAKSQGGQGSRKGERASDWHLERGRVGSVWCHPALDLWDLMLSP